MYSDFRKSGGSMSGYYEMGATKIPTVEQLISGKNADKLAENIVQTLSQSDAKNLANKPWKVLTSPLDLISAINETTESATRMANFVKARQGGTLGGVKVPEAISSIFPSWKSFEPESVYKAGYIAKSGTIDFSKMGSAARVLNMWVPFLNARWQGYLGIVNAFKRIPAGHLKLPRGWLSR